MIHDQLIVAVVAIAIGFIAMTEVMLALMWLGHARATPLPSALVDRGTSGIFIVKDAKHDPISKGFVVRTRVKHLPPLCLLTFR
jgi:hypothetical protein